MNNSKTAIFKNFVEKAKSLGAWNAKIIKAKTIKTAAWTKIKCKYGCGGYNSSHCCPPNTPSYKETQEIIDCFTSAILIHSKSHGLPKKIVVKLEREIFLSGYYKAFGFGCGPCRLCDECDPNGCRHTEEARPSMEACGIDVYETARKNGFPIEVVRNRNSEVNFYALVLIE